MKGDQKGKNIERASNLLKKIKTKELVERA